MRGIPHRLFGAWDGKTACSAADWAIAARREVEGAHAAGLVPILVGGTGLYLRTLIDGIAPIPEIHPDLRASVRAMAAADAYAALLLEDPVRAAALNQRDSQRIARALEVVRSTGRTLGEWQMHREGGIGGSVKIAPLILLPDREALYARCDERFIAMLDGGAVEEVKALMKRGLSRDLPVMRAIGVPEIAGWLRGDWSREDAIVRAQQATRNYAKRQFTWLRNQLPEDWPRLAPENINLDNEIETLFLD